MKFYKPVTPGRRQMTSSDFSGLAKTGPLKFLTKKLKNAAGRASNGRLTSRHRGGGHKRLYRLVDFKQDKIDIPARVGAIQYDPYRTARIALVIYADGEKRYILSPEGLKPGDKILVFSGKGNLEAGSRMKLKFIPQGTLVHNIELNPGQGGKMARAAGSAAEVLATEGKYTQLKMPSGEVRMILAENYASIGQLSNPEHIHINLGKAGRSRWLGRRPRVRGSAMNPVDHAHGGGEGRQPIGLKMPKTPWGKPARGVKTRKRKKRSGKLILRRRK
ncbi:MAG: 50S ribosomal protein L2 [Parcubacteria group bacterium]|nr:50S ribosomal protein L2 [Parcubacteria group bacterium]